MRYWGGMTLTGPDHRRATVPAAWLANMMWIR
jgi:hypothetical protein